LVSKVRQAELRRFDGWKSGQRQLDLVFRRTAAEDRIAAGDSPALRSAHDMAK
jgi:hypothetical protein